MCMRRSAAKARRRMSWRRCRRAPSSTISWTTIHMRRSWTCCSARRSEMTDVVQTTPKPKKSVALSGVVAGNTALCTVGRTGNDLHYRGYDILDVAEQCEFEEIAFLLVHGNLPGATELAAYKTKLRSLRGIPASVRGILE